MLLFCSWIRLHLEWLPKNAKLTEKHKFVHTVDDGYVG